MAEPTDYEIAALMQQFGGTFVAKLATAWMVADENNRRRLTQAFAEEWDEYRQVILWRRRQEATRDHRV